MTVEMKIEKGELENGVNSKCQCQWTKHFSAPWLFEWQVDKEPIFKDTFHDGYFIFYPQFNKTFKNNITALTFPFSLSQSSWPPK